MANKDQPYYPSRRANVRKLLSEVTGIVPRSQVEEMNRAWQEATDSAEQSKIIGEFKMSEIICSTKGWRSDLTDEQLAVGLKDQIESQRRYLEKSLGPRGWHMYLAWREEEQLADPFSPLTRARLLEEQLRAEQGVDE